MTESVLTQPQPVGVFPLPAGNLVIGPGEGHDETRTTLCAGKRPESFPSTLTYYELALDGDIDGALAALDGDSVIDRVNRLVLSAEPDHLALAAELIDRDTSPNLSCHVDTVAYTLGLRDEPPAIPSTDHVSGEFLAMARAANAAAALAGHDRSEAIDHLEEAARAADPVSAPLAGQLLGQLANAQVDDGGAKRAVVTFEAALDKLAGTDLAVSRAELHTSCGATYQEMSESAPRLMQQAINHYHQALALVSRETAPEVFAIANANLGLAYLMMPMHEASDQLRMGVAVQSMRDALEVFTPETHPDRWSSTQLNLANALVYLPSKHQADNIAEAVDLYEGVLAQRDRDTDPQGRARVLANQGNALAHLGHFDDAKIRLLEARAIFAEFDELEAVSAVASVLDELARAATAAGSSP